MNLQYTKDQLKVEFIRLKEILGSIEERVNAVIEDQLDTQDIRKYVAMAVD